MSVALRPLALADADQVLAWRNSPAVAPYMYSDGQISPDTHAAFMQAALHLPDRTYWVILWQGEAVGLANLTRIDLASRKCDWAYYLADPRTRGQGVGQAVEFAVLDHVFHTLKLNKLWCEVFLDNEAVWRLHERFGFVREALFRAHVIKGGAPRDVVGLGLLAADWPKARADALTRFAEKGLKPARLVAQKAR